MTPFVLVTASIVALLVAPLLARLLTARPALASLLDAFVVVSIAGVVALHVLPQSVSLAGSKALLAFLVGMLVPALLHRFDDRAHSESAARTVRDAIAYALFLAALAMHALIDGVALVREATGDGDGSSALALGVILHRLPVGLALWVVLRPRVGLPRTLVVAGTYIAGTIAGALAFTSSGPLHDALGVLPSTSLGAFQALVAGSILHVVTEAPVLGDHTRASRWLGVLGAALSVALLIALGAHDHELQGVRPGSASMIDALTLALRAAPAYLIGLVSVGVITAVAPARLNSLLGPVGHVVPALALTAALLSPPVFALRTFAVVLTASLSLAVVGQTLVDDLTPRTTTAWRRFRDGARHALDHTLPWIVAALVATTLIHDALPRDALLARGFAWSALAIGGAALAGAPLYLCAAGVTPLAAALAGHGLSSGAAIALMLTGPGLSWASLRHIRTAHGARAATATLVVVAGVALAAGFTAHALRLPLASPPRYASPVELAVGGGALVVVALLLLGSLLRQGVRGFVEQVLTPAHALEDAHVHGPSCAHDHGASRPPFTRKRDVHAARVALPFDPRSSS